VKIVADEVFGKDNFRDEIAWKRTASHSDIGQGAEHLGRQHDTIFWVSKSEASLVNMQFRAILGRLHRKLLQIRSKKGQAENMELIIPAGRAA